MPTRILIAEDHKIMREGLRQLMDAEHDMEVVAEAENGRTAVRLTAEFAPEAVVMDVGMPDLNGIDATRQILSHHPKTKVVALSMHSDRHHVVDMLRAGATAYVLKETAFSELTTAIRSVMAGHVYLPPQLTDTVVDELAHHGHRMDAPDSLPLSAREREVLQLIAEGVSTRQIAKRLSISAKTVETHRSNLMAKLNIHNVAELTKFAIREGITELNT